MLQLTRNQENNLAATLKDNEVAGSGTNYLFEFSGLHQTPVYVIPVVNADTSRSTQFMIELNATQDALNGVIQLRPGHYDLKVYRQTNATNLDPTDAVVDGLIHETEAFVEAASSESTDIFYSTTISDSIYYEQT